MSFLAALEDFLRSVREKDVARFEHFLRDDIEFVSVLPGGQVFENVADYRAIQRSWFSAKSGMFDYSIVRVLESESLGSAMVRVDYRNTTDTGISFRADLMISFSFQKKDANWYLALSQNTVLEEVVID